MGTNWSESEEDSKESDVSLKSDRSQHYKMWSSVRVHLESLRSDTSCASAERDNSQGCTAHVKETPPSPKEKPEDLIGADIDSVRDDEDWFESLYSLMAKGSRESSDSGVSFKSDKSKSGLIYFKDRVSPSRCSPDFSSSEEELAVADDKDLVECPDDLMAKGSMESIDSGVSFKSDTSKRGLTNFKDRVSLSGPDFSSSEEELDVAGDEDLVQSSYSLMAQRSFEAFGSSLSSMNDSFIRNQQHSFSRMVLRSMDAFGSGLSSISDSFIRTGQRSPPSSPDFSSSEEEHVVADDEDLVKSSDDLPEDLIGADIDSVRDDEDLVKSSDDLMAKGSMESIDSGVSLKSDGSNRRLIDFKDSSSLRPDFSSSEEELDVADDEDWFESLYSLFH